jgi:hypothetical protein
MPIKKRVHLQLFGIIQLPNPNLTYIMNPERNEIMFMPFHLLKTYIRNPSLFFVSFFTPTYRETPMATTIGARIYARGQVSFAKFLFLPSWFAKLLETIFCFVKIRWMPSQFAKLLELL